VKVGFPPDRLFAAGFGEHRPKYPNDSEEHRRLNRRVEIGVTPLQSNSSNNESVAGTVKKSAKEVKR
jgi:hypothetical protein